MDISPVSLKYNLNWAVPHQLGDVTAQIEVILKSIIGKQNTYFSEM